MSGTNDLWIFGYGSLMWRPGFDFQERHPALLKGYHRSLCIFSHVHRGTPERPGLVLGLDRGGSCRGVAFRVAGPSKQATIAYLRNREQATAVYVEATLPVILADGRRLLSVGYIVDRKHPQYAGRLPLDELLSLIRQGRGISGNNIDYIRATHEHLLDSGIDDPILSAIMSKLPARLSCDLAIGEQDRF